MGCAIFLIHERACTDPFFTQHHFDYDLDSAHFALLFGRTPRAMSLPLDHPRLLARNTSPPYRVDRSISRGPRYFVNLVRILTAAEATDEGWITHLSLHPRLAYNTHAAGRGVLRVHVSDRNRSESCGR